MQEKQKGGGMGKRERVFVRLRANAADRSGGVRSHPTGERAPGKKIRDARHPQKKKVNRRVLRTVRRGKRGQVCGFGHGRTGVASRRGRKDEERRSLHEDE